ncbi:hypothetical protein [Helicobacter cetorum]|uniref:hypothetical protein n=1 Tax=Helicobacter cetorum TaxID=138563 RepID=UPI0002E22DD4|nr:hypothetical protein [Helicobacter cetorum]
MNLKNSKKTNTTAGFCAFYLRYFCIFNKWFEIKKALTLLLFEFFKRLLIDVALNQGI